MGECGICSNNCWIPIKQKNMKIYIAGKVTGEIKQKVEKKPNK